jgi:hypothetical protein
VKYLELNREKVKVGWRKLYNQKLHNRCHSPNIIRVTDSRRMRRAWHETHISKIRNTYRILNEKLLGLLGRCVH